MYPTRRFTTLMAAIVCVAAAIPAVRADGVPEVMPAVGRKTSAGSFIRRTAFLRVSLWHDDADPANGCADECGEPSGCTESRGESACISPQAAAPTAEPNPDPDPNPSSDSQPEYAAAPAAECCATNTPHLPDACQSSASAIDSQPPAPSAKCVLPASCCESERAGVWRSQPCAENGFGADGTCCDTGHADRGWAAGASCSRGCGCGCPGNGSNTGCLGRMFGGRAASCSCDSCDYCGKGQGATLFDRLFGCMTPSGACAQGAPLLGKYQITYAHQPDWADPRDSQAWAAQGYGMPVTVPAAPVVRFTYNYSHGTPASRLTPLSTYNPATAPKSLYLQSWH